KTLSPWIKWYWWLTFFHSTVAPRSMNRVSGTKWKSSPMTTMLVETLNGALQARPETATKTSKRTVRRIRSQPIGLDAHPTSRSIVNTYARRPRNLHPRRLGRSRTRCRYRLQERRRAAGPRPSRRHLGLRRDSYRQCVRDRLLRHGDLHV